MMFRCFGFVIVLTFAIACTRLDNGQPSAPPADPEAPPGALLAGQTAYERVCASCHQEGLGGAPAVGDRAAWADRSSSWVGVLEEHAKNGYLAMPPRGGDPTLSDQEVVTAAEHMLTLTHPEQRPD